jgi:hypothetical protein
MQWGVWKIAYTIDYTLAKETWHSTFSSHFLNLDELKEFPEWGKTIMYVNNTETFVSINTWLLNVYAGE